MIQNIGVKDCFVELGGTAVKNVDIMLSKNGGMILFDSGAIPIVAVEAVTAQGTTTVVVVEAT